MRYQHKPTVIEAEQWFPGKRIEGVENAEDVYMMPKTLLANNARIRTLEGILWVNPGDYIVTGTKGEKYPVKPDIFEAIYEEAPNA